MRDGYLTTQFSADLDRLGFKSTRKVTREQLDALAEALAEVARETSDEDVAVVLDADVRTYVRAMHERATGRPPRCPDFEEVVQGSTWLIDPADPSDALEAFDTAGDVPPAGLLCLGEWKSGELWIVDVTTKAGYVYLVTEKREIVPMFRSIGEFAQWAVANELWKRRLAKEGELPERLAAIHFFKTISHLREAGLVPATFKPTKLYKPSRPRPVTEDEGAQG